MINVTHNEVLATVDVFIDDQQRQIQQLMGQKTPLSAEDIILFKDLQAELLRLVIFQKAFAKGTGYDQEVLEEILDCAE
jgi:hypothetical protein